MIQWLWLDANGKLVQVGGARPVDDRRTKKLHRVYGDPDAYKGKKAKAPEKTLPEPPEEPSEPPPVSLEHLRLDPAPLRLLGLPASARSALRELASVQNEQPTIGWIAGLMIDVGLEKYPFTDEDRQAIEEAVRAAAASTAT